ncbi:Scarecrow-like protein 28 [Sesamum angolense]|uniref:Scarecrow-like protein 28 n=1 Tax=Sesamum angolense TaxID=2727404 RepID=A0AAE1WWF1_9LAMI|nr:Scarecrow-like protein 28 [Sesamum angolense]
MLAGCSSTLLSPRHRLRSETSAQFQACHIPTMSTQRLDLPCSFARKDASRSQPVRPAGLSIEKPIEAKSSGCSLRQNIKLPPVATEGRRENKDEFWEKSKSIKKRYAGEVSYDHEESYMSRVKRKRGNGKSDGSPVDEGHLSLGQLSSDNFWFHPGFNVPRSIPQVTGLSTTQVPFSLSCSGEEERVCFVPSDVIAPPLPPLSNIPWFDSVVTEITDLGDKNVETIKGPEKEASGSSSTSSGSQRLVLGLGGNPVEHEIGNGSSPHNPSESTEVVVARHNGENNHREHDCIELVSLLVACAEQIGSKNIAAVNHCLARLGELASPLGSPLHRLVAYFTEGLALRVARLWPHIFHITTPRELDRVDEDSGTALRLLNQVSPIPKFIHFTSNEILLRAFEGKDRVHIIDFDIKQGLQWPSLFQSLASRTHPPSHVRITGIGESKQELIETGDRLAGFAEALNLPFEFIQLSIGWKTRNDNGFFLGLIRSTNAEAIIMAEQEASHNEITLDARLSNSLKYYSAVFDSVDSNLPLDSPVRIKIEEMFAREIRNIIACEGRDRYERHETFEKWQQLMEQGGFRCMGISDRELLQGQMMLKMYSCESYRVDKREQNGAASLTLSWLDQPLYTVSAWTPIDMAGGSQPS